METDIVYCLQCGAANVVDQIDCFACDKPLTDSADNDQAFFIHERYCVLSRLGTGGFGAVYKVADTHAKASILALKQINLGGLSSQQVIEATDAFNREVAFLSSLKHPNLPRVHDHFTDPEHWYLTMDFIEGDTLEAYLERKGATRSTATTEPLLPLPELLDIALQLCAVLGYLHTRQPAIIFRDLKPANIMLTPRRHLYLIDFGIARHFKPGQAKDTIPFGSPGYAAPEQYGKAQTSSRSDIYSLGALLHYLLSGVDPADNPFIFSPLHLTALAGATQLEDLVMSMVSLQPERRPTSIVFVETMLRKIADLQPGFQPPRQPIFFTPPTGTSAMPSMGQVQVPKPQVQTQSPARLTRRSIILGLAATGTTAAVLGGTYALGVLQSKRGAASTIPEAQSRPNDTQVRFAAFASGGKYAAIAFNDSLEILTINKGSSASYATYPLQRAPYSFAISPDGSHIGLSDMGGYISVWDVSSHTQLFSYYADTAKGWPLYAHLAWSPDNQHFANVGSDSEGDFEKGVAIRDSLDHAHMVQAYPGIQKPIESLAWSPNEEYIAAVDGEELYIWSTRKSSGPQMGTLGPDGLSDYSQVVWSADSTGLACYDSQGNIQVWSLRGEKLQRQGSISTEGKVIDLTWSPDGKYIVSASPYQLVLLDARKVTMLDQSAMNQFIIAVYWPEDSQGIVILNSAGNASPIDLVGETRFG